MRAEKINKLTRAETKARDEKFAAMLAEGKSYQEIADELKFANAKVAQVKACKMKFAHAKIARRMLTAPPPSAA